MQLVLLSGESGKNLWPLCNNARSKQFLSLFKKEKGVMESMVQRVVRQIYEIELTKNITIVTNNSQLDIITNQLGSQVDMVVEPEYRGTFSAISLVCSYLSLEKKYSDDEVVIVMPCDTYTQIEYFYVLAKIARCVEASVADLILMGITPTCPSAKYAYILPKKDSENRSSMLKSFCEIDRYIENVSVSEAEYLLNHGAFWNAGVFAFRLGYIMQIVRKYVQCDIFAEVQNNYNLFPKVSFDCEVVEKLKSIVMVPFQGPRKDLGTWGTLTDELGQFVIGNAILGSNCQNTHVINELQYPIFVNGVKNLVVAACPDGILVCAKDKTDSLQKYIGPLCTRPMYEERRWGTYRVLDDANYADGHHALTKTITLTKGKNISYQIHHHRTEVWTIVEGNGLFVLNGQERTVKVGDTLVIPVECWHAIKAFSKMTFIEVQLGNPLIEEDIERSEWKW